MSIYRDIFDLYPLDIFVTSRVTIKTVHERRIKTFSFHFIFLLSTGFFSPLRRV
jgi:hypothetical protein